MYALKETYTFKLQRTLLFPRYIMIIWKPYKQANVDYQLKIHTIWNMYTQMAGNLIASEQ